MRSRRRGSITAVLAVIAFGGTVVLSSTVVASSLKKEKIIRKHVAAVGGKKLRSIDAIRVVGHVEVRGIEASFIAWKQRPDLSRLEVSVLGYDVIQAYDGHTAWWVNPIVGATYPEKMPPEYAWELMRWTDFDGPLVDYRKKRHKVKYMGDEMLDTGRAHKLRVRFARGDEWFVYIDSETYMEVKRTYLQTYQGKTGTVETLFSDFVDIDGVMTPRVIHSVGYGGEPFRMTFETLYTDVEVDKTRFTMPGAKKRRFGFGY